LDRYEEHKLVEIDLAAIVAGNAEFSGRHVDVEQTAVEV